MGESRGNYLTKNIMFFLIGSVGTKVITFLLTPLYTNYLHTGEYGTADLINTISWLLAPVLTLNISEAVMRFELDKEADRREILKIGIRIFEISIFIGLLLIPLYRYILPLSSYSVYIFFYIVSISVSQIFLYDLRGKEMLLQYSLGNMILALLVVILSVYFLAISNCGVKGYLLAYIIANLTVAFYAIIIGKGYQGIRKIKLNKLKMQEMLRFSVVLIPNTFMWWIMNSSDRIMVTAMVGNQANGIYAISYKIPTLVSMLTGVFNQAWNYSAIREEGVTDESEYSNKVFKLFISSVILLGIGILTIMKPFLKLYVEESYYYAWKYTPFLMIGCVYLALGTFISTSYNVHKDSFGFLISASMGAAVNIILNFLMIPQYKVYGAAFATCISYIVVFIFRYFYTRKYMKYNLRHKEFIVGSVLLIASSVCIYVDNYIGLLCQVFIFLGAIILYSRIYFSIVKKIIRKSYRQRIK